MAENEENTSLEDAVSKAAAEQDESSEGETSTEETSTEEKKEEAKLDARTTQALELLEALEDPKRATEVVRHMARQAGLLTETPVSKKEEAKVIKSIKDIVKEKLGDTGAWMADSLGDALEEVFREHSSRVDEKIEASEIKREAEKFERDYKAAVTELKITEAEALEISKLADEIPWTGRSPLNTYLSRMIKLVRSEASEKSKSNEVKQKQQANLRSQTKTLGVESNEDRIKAGSHKISAREAVLAAQRGELLE